MGSLKAELLEESILSTKVLDIVQHVLYGKVPVAIAVVSIALIIFALSKFLTPELDPLEPPCLKPTIPLVGHIIGIIQHQSNYHKILSNKRPSEPCVTLPMLNGKLYAVYDPYLIQQVLRARTASFEIFQKEFAQKTFGLSQDHFDKIQFNPDLLPEFTDAIHQSFQTESLYKMNMRWLKDFAQKMDPISGGKAIIDPMNLGRERDSLNGGLEIDNFYLWCRDVMTLATTRALYGNHDPFVQDKSLVDAIWTYEESIPYFLLSLVPSITIPRAYKARQKLQRAMKSYYAANHDISDPTTSTLTYNRASTLRKHGFTAEEVGMMELILPAVSTLNAVPTLFWLLLYILQNPMLVESIRKEVYASVHIIQSSPKGGRTVIMDISKFDIDFPLLVSCYRETMRLVNHSVSNRRMTEDLTITTQNGQSYVLKKGVDVQLPAGVIHAQASIWGPDAATFNPQRFLSSSSKVTEADRIRKTAYIPFGGGRHLCPGRNFAFAEIIGFAAVLLLGFDVEPRGMKFEDMKMRGPLWASGTVKPVGDGEGLGARIKVRKGWEGVCWRFGA